MRALTLDYRRSPGRRWSGAIFLAAGVACAALVGVWYQQALDAQAVAEAGINSATVAERRLASRREAAVDPRQLARELGRARKLLLQLSMPWDEVFSGVEAADSRNVGVLRIESDVDRRRLKIDAEAKNIGSMLKYVRAMESQPSFTDVFLQSHQIVAQDARRPVHFVLTATWRAIGNSGT